MVTENRHIVTKRPKLTDAERYKRFLDAAKEAGASDDPMDFDRAFRQVVIEGKTRGSAKPRP